MNEYAEFIKLRYAEQSKFSKKAAVAAAALRKKDSQAVKATALQAFENELGVQAPLGFWDPAAEHE